MNKTKIEAGDILKFPSGTTYRVAKYVDEFLLIPINHAAKVMGPFSGEKIKRFHIGTVRAKLVKRQG